jgi:alkanesulfonate monooxygenase SsuD/methylene tetrahydromethanopterin reductase-like flavin-dependent oxidoreductase (luciferase family)
MDEGIEILQRCFSGERFSWHGKRYRFEDVQITPGYVQSGGPPLWIASMSEAGALRAARFGTNYLPQGLRSRAYDPWVEALEARGRQPKDHRIGIIRSILVTDDKETDWQIVRAAEAYRMVLYKQFFAESGEGFGEAGEPVPQTWIAGDVEHCVAEIERFVDEFGITDIVTMAVPPGLRADQLAPSLERLFTEVAPRVKQAVNGTHR